MRIISKNLFAILSKVFPLEVKFIDIYQFFSYFEGKIKVLIFILVFHSFDLVSQSIFYLPYGELILELNSNDKICVVKQINLLNYNDFFKKKCEILNLELYEILVQLGKSTNRKEIAFAFFSEKNEKVSPKFQLNNKSYTLLSLIFNKKENIYKLELLDSESNYHYLIKDIKSIKVKN